MSVQKLNIWAVIRHQYYAQLTPYHAKVTLINIQSFNLRGVDTNMFNVIIACNRSSHRRNIYTGRYRVAKLGAANPYACMRTLRMRKSAEPAEVELVSCPIMRAPHSDRVESNMWGQCIFTQIFMQVTKKNNSFYHELQRTLVTED